MMRIVFSFLLIFFVLTQANLAFIGKDDLGRTWANTKLTAMTKAEKIGQLFMVQAYSNLGEKHKQKLIEAITKYHIGGLAFFQGTPGKQAELTKELQSRSKIPLLIAIDAEWGLGMRLENSISYPRQFTLGAIQDNKLIYEMGKEIGRQLKRIGVHMNFAPVVDINTIPNNPIINDRSFGQDKRNVSRKAYAYMKGMQDEGILACAKHFPGHGSTIKDSHKSLPVIRKDLASLRELEMFPFRLLFKQGIKSVMVGHLQVPAMDDRKNRPASLSDRIIQKTIREEFQYDGLILTDALGMRGVSDYFKAGEIEVEALLAGNDILTVSQSLSTAYDAVQEALKTGRISMQRVELSLLRILIAKFEAGLFFPPSIDLANIDKDINSGQAMALKEDLYRNAITYLGKAAKGLPVSITDKKNIATISIGATRKTKFQERVDSYVSATHYQMHNNPGKAEIDRIFKKLENKDEIIVSFHNMSKRLDRNFGISKQSLMLIKILQKKVPVHIVIFGSPYSLSLFGEGDDIVLAYEDDSMAQDMAAQAIFGSIDIRGKLPVDGGLFFKTGDGKYVPNAHILSYSVPEFAGLSSDTLAKIEELIMKMINTGAAPGCQVLVAKNGKIVYDKAFGYQTYDKKRRISKDDVYDLASVTKVMATTLSVMRLYEQKKIDIFKPIADYVDGYIDSSDKSEIKVIEALTHHSGLKAWIPFYKSTMDTLMNDEIIPSPEFYRHKIQGDFIIKVADNLYMRKDYVDTIWKRIYDSELRDNKDYKYSDLGLFMIRQLVDAQAGMPLEDFVQKELYEPMGLVHTAYNPWERFPKAKIVPTEQDDYFRMQRIQGYVHDMGAAMLGGVSGHAGLFSNTKDLATLAQMLLNGGTYGKKKYFDYKTIYTFTTRYQRSSRRGIGFDMKELDSNKNLNMSELAPVSTFGHLGFTGTCFFADPDNDIVYVFLSNRTFPTMLNKKFGKESYRSKIQTVIYQALID